MAFYRRSLLYIRNNILFMEKITLSPPHLAYICPGWKHLTFLWYIILSHLKTFFI
jgi:hypothetical protein